MQLQRPSHIYFQGAVRPWDDAVLHVSTEAVTRGLNVFEGLKGYWQPDGAYGLVALHRHWRRLQRSARLLHIPFEMSFAEFENACHALAQRLYRRGTNMWLRTTLFVVEGHWGEGTRADLFITAYHTASSPPEPADIGVSTWQRAPDLALPCRIKTSTNYQVARLAKIEARGRGYSEMVLLNQHGRVAEALGTCILMVRDGCVVTPPPWEGALESITVDLVEQLCKSLCIGFVRRPIERSELAVADEIALAGTLAEVTRVQTLEGVPLPESPITEALQRAYLAVVEGRDRSIDAGLSSRRPPEANDQPILVRPLVARDAPVAGAVPQPAVGALSR